MCVLLSFLHLGAQFSRWVLCNMLRLIHEKKICQTFNIMGRQKWFFCNMLILIQERKNIKTFNIMGRQKWWKTFQQNVVPERRKENRSNNTGLKFWSFFHCFCEKFVKRKTVWVGKVQINYTQLRVQTRTANTGYKLITTVIWANFDVVWYTGCIF